MACGLPLVTTDVGDVRERLAGASGCRIEPRIEGAFVTAIMSLLETGERTDARSRLADLEPQKVARRVLGVYEDVLAREPRRFSAIQRARGLTR